MIEVHTPCRLHFGLLAYSRDDSRQYGGVGLMASEPRTLVRLAPAKEVTAEGPMGDKAAIYARRYLEHVGADAGARIEVVRVARPHTGLGSGTQLAMAIGRGLAKLLGHDQPDPAALARIMQRGKRSAIGTWGSYIGGLLVEGGKTHAASLSPLIARHDFPDDWRLVLIRPRPLEGLAGERETQAFVELPAIPDDLTARMCRLVMLGLLPALVERDVQRFGEALYELQQRVGEVFAPFQGGIYADPLLAQIVGFVREQGIPGIGQSSWGPTLYAVLESEERAVHLADAVMRRFKLDKAGEVIVTRGDNAGAGVSTNF
ncbi:MAG: beta-ribofuranosylaminobenzene 5'-phosphate synthase family protein [Phycisphaeraceae bacterium]